MNKVRPDQSQTPKIPRTSWTTLGLLTKLYTLSFNINIIPHMLKLINIQNKNNNLCILYISRISLLSPFARTPEKNTLPYFTSPFVRTPEKNTLQYFTSPFDRTPEKNTLPYFTKDIIYITFKNILSSVISKLLFQCNCFPWL